MVCGADRGPRLATRVFGGWRGLVEAGDVWGWWLGCLRGQFEWWLEFLLFTA